MGRGDVMPKALAPWEKYASENATQEVAPWDKYAKLGISTEAEPLGKPKIIEEMHSEVNDWDRFAIKNFGVDPQQSAQYLKTKYPHLQVDVGDGGRLLIKAPKEKEYRVLDPKGITSAAEAVRDVGDSLIDLLSGVGEGAVATAAGLAAAPISGGAAAVPAAMAAGGIAGTSLETLRQAIGSQLGVNQQYDPTAIGFSGLLGAAAPALMGTGATLKQAMKTATAENLMPIQVLKSQRGYIGRAISKYLPRVGSAMAGVPVPAIKAQLNAPELVSKLQDQNVNVFAKEVAKNLADTLRNVKNDSWKKYEKALLESDAIIDIEPAKDILQNAVDTQAMKAASTGAPEDIAVIKQMQNIVDKTFPQEEFLARKMNPATGKMIGIPTPASKVRFLKSPLVAEQYLPKMNKLSTATKLKPNELQMMSPVQQQATRAQQLMSLAAGDAANVINAQIKQSISPEGNAAKQAFMTARNLQPEMKALFKTPKKALSTLRTLPMVTNESTLLQLADIDKMYGTRLLDKAATLQAYSAFSKGADVPLEFGGSRTSRMFRNAGIATGIGSGLGYLFGAQTGVQGGAGVGAGTGFAIGALFGGPMALKQYIRASRGIRGGVRKLRDTSPIPLSGIPTTLQQTQLGGEE